MIKVTLISPYLKPPLITTKILLISPLSNSFSKSLISSYLIPSVRLFLISPYLIPSVNLKVLFKSSYSVSKGGGGGCCTEGALGRQTDRQTDTP